MSEAREPAVVLGAALGMVTGAAFWAGFPPWAEDWDSLGFLASVGHFDLKAFAPHPPGYPVYVALLKLASFVTHSALGAARWVAVLSGLVTYGAVWVALATWRTPSRLAPPAAAFVCVTPLAFRAFSSVSSEAPALAFAALALAGVAMAEAAKPAETPAPADARAGTTRSLVVGVAVGLGLGARLSWAPLYGAFLVVLTARLRLRACLFAFGACLVWAVPLAVLTGPARLLALGRTQLQGHLGRWGGTALTQPVRARFLARDLFVDGFGVGDDALGVAIAVLLVVVSVGLTVRAARSHSPRLRPPPLRPPVLVLVLGLPYLLWIALGQNLREQPRHVLPLVALLSLVVVTAAASVSADDPRPPKPAWIRPALLTLPMALLVGSVVTRTLVDTALRARNPPPAIQLLAYLRAHFTPGATVLFAGASGRFLDGTEWQPRTHAASRLGDALLAATHLDGVPPRFLVTGELSARDESPVPLRLLATFCRPGRLDRRAPCLELYELDGRAALAR